MAQKKANEGKSASRKGKNKEEEAANKPMSSGTKMLLAAVGGLVIAAGSGLLDSLVPLLFGEVPEAGTMNTDSGPRQSEFGI